MKKLVVFIVLTLTIAALTIAAGGACPANKTISNNAQNAFTGLSSTPANVICRIWDFGSGGSNHSATMAAKSAGSGCSSIDNTALAWETSSCFSAGYAVVADWVDATQFPSGCPVNTDRMVVLLEDNTGKYGLLTRTGTLTSFWQNLDDVGIQAAVSLPSPTLGSANESGGTWTVPLTWTAASVYGAYASGDQPGSPVVTGYKIYVWTGSGSPVSRDHTAAGWALATGGTVTPGSATGGSVTFTADHANSQWVAMSLTFDSGYESTYVGAPVQVAGPTGAGVFGSVTASQPGKDVTVAWTTNTEAGVVRYDIYWEPNNSGPWRLVKSVPVQGDSPSYNVSFTPPALAGPRASFVKVAAIMAEGPTQWSPVVRVGG